MNARPRVLVVQNSRRSGPGRLSGWLDDDGIEAVVLPGSGLPARMGELVPAADGLVLLGGPFMPDDEKLAAVRAALPAVEAGIYLNAGSVGPLPAETATAMADLEAWELRTGRAHVDYFQEFLARMDGLDRFALPIVLGTAAIAGYVYYGHLRDFAASFVGRREE